MAPEEVTDAEEPQGPMTVKEQAEIFLRLADADVEGLRARNRSLLDEVAALRAELEADQARADAIITELADAARAQLAEKDLALAFKEGQYHDEMAEAVAEVAALREQLRERGPCPVCWTTSWAPCEKGTKDAEHDPCIEGGWMVCVHCAMQGALAALSRQVETLRKALRSVVEDCASPSFSDPRIRYIEVQHDVSEVEEWRVLAVSEGTPKIGCDYCDDGVPVIDGWHVLVDPEGVEGDQRIPCPREP